MSDHKQWLDNEYQQWIKALQESTVHNFKEHPGVKRMLSLDYDKDIFAHQTYLQVDKYKKDVWSNLCTIRDLGGANDCDFWFYRMLHYAHEILSRSPSSICEIGGGVGQFYAILRALGWDGLSYNIVDLPEVISFQKEYLHEVQMASNINQMCSLSFGMPYITDFDLLISFYALGEFDNETRQQYKNLIDNTPHGYIAFNPHSGASDSLSIFENHDIKVTPGIEPGISIIEW